MIRLNFSNRCSIVAVHGLNANPYWTWVGKRKASKDAKQARGDPASDSEQPIIWLERYLPVQVPKCRILSFGYRSDYLQSAPKRDIGNCAQELLMALRNYRSKDEARRPIVFIGHSFGGIVIKQVK
jgi:hypothetical protein